MSSILLTPKQGRGKWCFSTNCILRWFLIFHYITTMTVAIANETHEPNFKQISSQIDALILQRQDDFNKLEALARNSLNKDAEIDQLRNEIRDLRMELDTVKAEKYSSADCAGGNRGASASGGNGCSNRVKNEQLTVEWLSNSISEIRAEVAEIAKSFNSTAVLQQRQSFSTDVSILQNDVVSLRHDAEHLKAEATKYDAKISTFGLDVDALKQFTSNVAAKVANLTQQIRAFSAYAYTYDWSKPMKSSKRSKHLAVFKKIMVLNENPLQMKVLTTTRRHRRCRFNHRNSNINEQTEVARDDNHSDSTDYDFSRQPGSGSITHRNEKNDQLRNEDLERRVRKLEIFMNETTPSRDKEQDKLRSSMLELLELVSNLEAKFDNVTPVLKKEISKMEFTLAEIVANLSIARELQDNDRLVVTAMLEDLSKTQSKLALYEHQWKVGPEKIIDDYSVHLNGIIQQQNWTQLSQDDNTSFLGLLSSLFKQYSDYIRRLPKSCEEVSGKSGTYELSIDDNLVPILAYCEINSVDKDPITSAGNVIANSTNAYVVIQRRTKNGQTHFNRDWQEYARGFGNLQGEFWLGNEIIHRLTRNNDTTLRIELEDDSGRRWYAEYDTFSVASRQQNFKLHVDGFSGNASDAFRYQNGMQFSTKDSDHDSVSDVNCAAEYESGWWFSHCQHINLNAKYNLGFGWSDLVRNEWISLSSAKMMITKRKRIYPDSSPHFTS